MSFRNIEQTIQHSVGMERLIGERYLKDHKCPSFMIGKSTLENYPGSKEPDPRPMALVHMDIVSSSVSLIEGYNYALIITDSCSEHRWQYRMKTRDEVLAISKRWVAGVTQPVGHDVATRPAARSASRSPAM